MATTYLKVFILFSLLSMFNACEDETAVSTACDMFVEIDPDRYQADTNPIFSIEEVTIVNDCLEVTYSSSGCDGSSWQVSMIDAGVVLESFPIQRELKMILENGEACDAVIQKTTSFDLTSIRTEDYTEILLNLDGYGQLRYSY
ncbi:MAG: hypothetical protein HRT61_14035 [Ekhidna sp.]|nr:hypothetical protein [Ekhidna sp.]